MAADHSKSSSNATTADNKINAPGGAAISGSTNTKLTANITTSDKGAIAAAQKATQAAANIANNAIFANQAVSQAAILGMADTTRDALKSNTDVVQITNATARDAINLSGDATKIVAGAFDLFSSTLAGIQGGMTAAYEKIKTNEQLGDVTQVTQIAKYAAIAVAVIFIAPALLKRA